MTLSSERVSLLPLEINSCGRQTLGDRDYHVVRSRLDYTLMYLVSGRALVRWNDREWEVQPGQAMLFLPGCRQEYLFFARDGSVNQWVHFSGTLCEALQGEEARVLSILDRNEFESSFERMIRAHSWRDDRRLPLSEGYLRVLLSLLLLSQQAQASRAGGTDHRLNEVLGEISLHFSETIDFDRLAEHCFLSRSRFDHIFKEYTGWSPLRYVLQLRLSRARQMLSESSLSVTECARTVGFRDVNYFCRLFKKQYGCTPLQFRRR